MNGQRTSYVFVIVVLPFLGRFLYWMYGGPCYRLQLKGCWCGTVASLPIPTETKLLPIDLSQTTSVIWKLPTPPGFHISCYTCRRHVRAYPASYKYTSLRPSVLHLSSTSIPLPRFSPSSSTGDSPPWSISPSSTQRVSSSSLSS